MNRKKEILKTIDELREQVVADKVYGMFLLSEVEDGINAMCFAGGSGSAMKLLGAIELHKTQLVAEAMEKVARMK